MGSARVARGQRLDALHGLMLHPVPCYLTALPGRMSDWVAHVDPSSGGTYYSNAKTGETSWDVPPGFRFGQDLWVGGVGVAALPPSRPV